MSGFALRSQDKIMCRVCLAANVEVLLDCGHVCLCKACSGRIKTCPLCRKTIHRTKSVFV